MDECPLRPCAYVYPDAEGNGDFGHLFNEGLITKFLAPSVKRSSVGWSKSGR
jgi:hypothetical protein